MNHICIVYLDNFEAAVAMGLETYYNVSAQMTDRIAHTDASTVVMVRHHMRLSWWKVPAKQVVAAGEQQEALVD